MQVKVKNARLSFPSLFQTAKFGGEDTGKYEATFILDKTEHAEAIKQIKAGIKKVADERLKGKVPPAEKLCLKDGDDLDRPEFGGKMAIKVSTKKRPLVIDRDKTPLVEADNKPYAGCYVNGIMTLWAQDNQYGKRVNGQLDGVQFYADGEPFGEAGVSVDDFDDVSDDDFDL